MQVPKTSPDDVARITFEALEASHREVRVDEVTRQVRAGFGATPAVRRWADGGGARVACGARQALTGGRSKIRQVVVACA